jgi:hypothetical protein
LSFSAGRRIQAIVARKHVRFRRPENVILQFLTAAECTLLRSPIATGSSIRRDFVGPALLDPATGFSRVDV